MKKFVTVLLVILAVLFLALAVYYFVTPADKVPDIISNTVSGYHPGRTSVNVKHGVAAIILAAGSGILAWFVSGNKGAVPVKDQPSEPVDTEKQ